MHTYEFILCEVEGQKIKLKVVKLLESLFKLNSTVQIINLSKNGFYVQTDDYDISFPKGDNRIIVNVKKEFFRSIIETLNQICLNQDLIIFNSSYDAWKSIKTEEISELEKFIGIVA